MNAFQSQPLDWEFDYVLLILPEVVLGRVHCFSQPKVSNFDDKVYIYPVEVSQGIQFIIWKKKTYMQFLAAKSLWTTLLLARYSIPFAT